MFKLISIHKRDRSEKVQMSIKNEQLLQGLDDFKRYISTRNRKSERKKNFSQLPDALSITSPDQEFRIQKYDLTYTSTIRAVCLYSEVHRLVAAKDHDAKQFLAEKIDNTSALNLLIYSMLEINNKGLSSSSFQKFKTTVLEPSFLSWLYDFEKEFLGGYCLFGEGDNAKVNQEIELSFGLVKSILTDSYLLTSSNVHQSKKLDKKLIKECIYSVMKLIVDHPPRYSDSIKLKVFSYILKDNKDIWVKNIESVLRDNDPDFNNTLFNLVLYLKHHYNMTNRNDPDLKDTCTRLSTILLYNCDKYESSYQNMILMGFLEDKNHNLDKDLFYIVDDMIPKTNPTAKLFTSLLGEKFDQTKTIVSHLKSIDPLSKNEAHYFESFFPRIYENIIFRLRKSNKNVDVYKMRKFIARLLLHAFPQSVQAPAYLSHIYLTEADTKRCMSYAKLALENMRVVQQSEFHLSSGSNGLPVLSVKGSCKAAVKACHRYLRGMEAVYQVHIFLTHLYTKHPVTLSKAAALAQDVVYHKDYSSLSHNRVRIDEDYLFLKTNFQSLSILNDDSNYMKFLTSLWILPTTDIDPLYELSYGIEDEEGVDSGNDTDRDESTPGVTKISEEIQPSETPAKHVKKQKAQSKKSKQKNNKSKSKVTLEELFEYLAQQDFDISVEKGRGRHPKLVISHDQKDTKKFAFPSHKKNVDLRDLKKGTEHALTHQIMEHVEFIDSSIA